jgi:hypothetical protein
MQSKGQQDDQRYETKHDSRAVVALFGALARDFNEFAGGGAAAAVVGTGAVLLLVLLLLLLLLLFWSVGWI